MLKRLRVKVSRMLHFYGKLSMSSTWTGQFVCKFTIVYAVQSSQHGAKGVASPGRHSHMLLCLAKAIKVQRAPVPTLQGEWYLSSLIKNICCAHARLLSLPPLSPKGILPHPPSLRKQQIFLIIYFPPPQPAFLSASKWLKFACCCHGGARW